MTYFEAKELSNNLSVTKNNIYTLTKHLRTYHQKSQSRNKSERYKRETKEEEEEKDIEIFRTFPAKKKMKQIKAGTLISRIPYSAIPWSGVESSCAHNEPQTLSLSLSLSLVRGSVQPENSANSCLLAAA